MEHFQNNAQLKIGDASKEKWLDFHILPWQLHQSQHSSIKANIFD